MIPLLQYPHKLEPQPRTAQLVSNLTALLNGVKQGSLAVLPSGTSAIAKEWVAHVRDELVVVPAELKVVLNSLPSKINADSDIHEDITILFTLGVLRVNKYQNKLQPIDRGSAVYATAILKQLRQAYSSECVAIGTNIWAECVDAAYKASLFEGKTPIKSLLIVSSRIGDILARLNIPQVYYHFESLLQHDWPEIRNEGAFWLRHWRSDSLLDKLLEALTMGKNDPIAPNFSKYILQLITRLQDATALPILQELIGTAFDGAPLQTAIISCTEGSVSAEL